MTIPIIEVFNVSKRFGAVEALKEVSLKILPGRVHTLLGENGAGKSTLMKILAGLYQPSSGEMAMHGKKLVLPDPKSARQAGIAIIYQELSLSKNMTVAENIYANHEPQRFGIINDQLLLSRAKKLLLKLAINIDPTQTVINLSMAQRQLVEIAKSLSYPADVIIMDEPTSSLSDNEADILFSIIETLKQQNKAIIYISHRMDEIMKISDDISVLRDGVYITTLKKSECTINQLITLMVGREMRDIYPPKLISPQQQNNILNIKNLHHDALFSNINFSLNTGEILGFFGLVGSGRSDVMKALFGVQAYQGIIEIAHNVVNMRCPSDAIKQGIAFVTENRKEQGLSLEHSVSLNINSVNFKQISNAAHILNRLKEYAVARRAINKMSIKTDHADTIAGHLSGGNQQKIVLAKWLENIPKILILDEPTRGVDVGAKYEIYKIIRELAANGTAIIMVSSELPEVMALSDRLIVMREKHIVKQFDQMHNLTQEVIMSYATGAHHDQ